jgi:hypothetical protein
MSAATTKRTVALTSLPANQRRLVLALAKAQAVADKAAAQKAGQA